MQHKKPSQPLRKKCLLTFLGQNYLELLVRESENFFTPVKMDINARNTIQKGEKCLRNLSVAGMHPPNHTAAEASLTATAAAASAPPPSPVLYVLFIRRYPLMQTPDRDFYHVPVTAAVNNIRFQLQLVFPLKDEHISKSLVDVETICRVPAMGTHTPPCLVQNQKWGSASIWEQLSARNDAHPESIHFLETPSEIDYQFLFTRQENSRFPR